MATKKIPGSKKRAGGRDVDASLGHMKPKWVRLTLAGARGVGRPLYNPAVLDAAARASGSYAVRTKKGHVVHYVGESHTGNMRRTLLRHFHAVESFTRDRRPAHGAASFASAAPHLYEVALWVTSRGKSVSEEQRSAARRAQDEWIKLLHPTKNFDLPVEEEEPYEPAEEDPDPWGGLLSNPAKRGAKRGVEAYAETHGGNRGTFRSSIMTAVDPTHGDLVVLGRLERVVYSTVKGAAGSITDYDHVFGEGKRGARPWLAFHSCSDKKCSVRGKLVVVGGTYRVTERGIVG